MGPVRHFSAPPESPSCSSRRELAPLEAAAILIYASALTCGVMAALARKIHLGHAGFDFVDLWQNMFSLGALQLPPPGPGGRSRAWPSSSRGNRGGESACRCPGAVFACCDGRRARHRVRAAKSAIRRRRGRKPGANVAANLAALCVAALMAMLGAYFTVRR